MRNAASISSASGLLAVGVAIAALASGCGGSSDASTGLSACEIAAENAAAAGVARAAFDAGKLGGVGSLSRFFKGQPRSAYLDEGGRLRPWRALSGSDELRFDLESWLGHVEGSHADGVGAKMYDARMQVRRSRSAGC